MNSPRRIPAWPLQFPREKCRDCAPCRMGRSRGQRAGPAGLRRPDRSNREQLVANRSSKELRREGTEDTSQAVTPARVYSPDRPSPHTRSRKPDEIWRLSPSCQSWSSEQETLYSGRAGPRRRDCPSRLQKLLGVLRLRAPVNTVFARWPAGRRRANVVPSVALLDSAMSVMAATRQVKWRCCGYSLGQRCTASSPPPDPQEYCTHFSSRFSASQIPPSPDGRYPPVSIVSA